MPDLKFTKDEIKKLKPFTGQANSPLFKDERDEFLEYFNGWERKTDAERIFLDMVFVLVHNSPDDIKDDIKVLVPSVAPEENAHWRNAINSIKDFCTEHMDLYGNFGSMMLSGCDVFKDVCERAIKEEEKLAENKQPKPVNEINPENDINNPNKINERPEAEINQERADKISDCIKKNGHLIYESGLKFTQIDSLMNDSSFPAEEQDRAIEIFDKVFAPLAKEKWFGPIIFRADKMDRCSIGAQECLMVTSREFNKRKYNSRKKYDKKKAEAEAKGKILQALLDPARNNVVELGNSFYKIDSPTPTMQRLNDEKSAKLAANLDLKNAVNKVASTELEEMYQWNLMATVNDDFNFAKITRDNPNEIKKYADLFDTLTDPIWENQEKFGISYENFVSNFYIGNNKIQRIVDDNLKDYIAHDGITRTMIAKVYTLFLLSKGEKLVTYCQAREFTDDPGFKSKEVEPIVIDMSAARQKTLDTIRYKEEHKAEIEAEKKRIEEENLRKEAEERQRLIDEENRIKQEEDQKRLNEENDQIKQADDTVNANEQRAAEDKNAWALKFAKQEYNNRNLKFNVYDTPLFGDKIVPGEFVDLSTQEKFEELKGILKDAGITDCEDSKSVRTVLAMYLIGVKGKTPEQIANLTPEEKQTIGNDFVNDFRSRPVMGLKAGSKENTEANLKWYGAMCGKVLEAFKKGDPYMYPGAEALNNPQTAQNALNSPFGLSYEIASRYMKLTEGWRTRNNTASAENPYGLDKGKSFESGYRENGKQADNRRNFYIYTMGGLYNIQSFGLSLQSLQDVDKENPMRYRIGLVKRLMGARRNEDLQNMDFTYQASDAEEWYFGWEKYGSISVGLEDNLLDAVVNLSEEDAKNLLAVEDLSELPDNLKQHEGVINAIKDVLMATDNDYTNSVVGPEIEKAFREVNESAHDEILSLPFNRPENMNAEPDVLHMDTQTLKEYEKVFNETFDPIMPLEQQMCRSRNYIPGRFDDITSKFYINGQSVREIAGQMLHVKDTSPFAERQKRSLVAKVLILRAIADPNKNLEYRTSNINNEKVPYDEAPRQVAHYTHEMSAARRQQIAQLTSVPPVVGPQVNPPVVNININEANININEANIVNPENNANLNAGEENIGQNGEEIPIQPAEEEPAVLPEHVDDGIMLVQNPALQKLYGDAMRLKTPEIEAYVATRRDDVNNTNLARPGGADEPTSEQIDSYFANAGLLSNRPDTHANDFLFYLMVKKNFSFEQAANFLPGSDHYLDYIKEFRTFVKDHPVLQSNENGQPLPADTRKENIKVWADFFKKCSQKIAEFKFPDIDYSNPEEVFANQAVLYQFACAVQDFSQELDSIKDKCYGEFRASFDQYEEMNAIAENWDTFKGLAQALEDGFFSNPAERPQVGRQIRKAAAGRAFLAEKGGLLRGKTVKQYLDSGNERMYEFPSYTVLGPSVFANPDEVLTADASFRYLKGENPEYPNQFRPKIANAVTDYRNTVGANYSAGATSRFAATLSNTFTNHPEIRDQLNTLFGNQNLDVHQLYNQLNNEQGKKTLNAIALVFKVFDADVQPFMRKAAGVEFMDTVRIDGKTPGELWTNDFLFIQNHAERQLMFQVMILKEYMTGTKPITVDNLRILDKTYESPRVVLEGQEKPPATKKPEVFITSTTYLGKDIKTIKRGYTLLKDVDTLRANMNKKAQAIQNAEQRISATDRPLLRASDSYAQMKASHDRVLELADTQHGKATGDLYHALLDYQKKVDAYIKERDSIAIREKTTRRSPALSKKGKALDDLRYKTAVADRKALPGILESLSRNAAGFGILEPNKEEMGSADKGKFTMLRQSLDLEVRLRGIDPNLVKPSVKPDEWTNENSLDWLLHPQANEEDPFERSLTAEEAQKLNAACGNKLMTDHFAKTRELGRHLIETEGVTAAIKNVGFNETREDTVLGVFMIWLMGEENYDIEQLGKLTSPDTLDANGGIIHSELKAKLPELEQKFLRFMTENPVSKAGIDKETFTASIEAWGEVFSKAVNKVKEYRIPDIDYTDVNAVKTKLSEFSVIRTLGINGGQEIHKILEANGPGEPAVDIVDRKLGETGKYWKLHKDWLVFEGFFSALASAYGPTSRLNFTEGDRINQESASNIRSQAASRVITGIRYNPFRGKTISDVMETEKEKVLYEDKLTFSVEHLMSQDEKEGCKDALGFLLGANKNLYEDKIRKVREKTEKVVRKEFPQTSYYMYANFINAHVPSDLKEKILQVDDTAGGMKEFLKNTSPENYSYMSLVESYLMGAFFSCSETKEMVAMSGTKFSKLFRFDGKTAEELWGNKYKVGENGILDEAQRDQYLKAEIVRKIFRGDSQVSVQKMDIGPDGKVKFVGESLVLAPADALERFMNNGFMGDIIEKELIHELEEIQKEFGKTQDNSQANRLQNDIREGSDLYQNLTLSLDKAIEALKKDTRAEGQIDRKALMKTLTALSTANVDYYEARKGRFFGPIRSYGQKRLALTGKVSETLSVFRDRMMKHYNGYKGDLSCAGVESKNASASAVYTKAKDLYAYLGKPEMSTQNLRKLQEKNYVKETLQEQYNSLVNMHEPKIPKGKENQRENYINAYNYLVNSTNNLWEKDDISFEDTRKLEHLDERISELVNNPLFTTCMKADPQSTIENFRTVEKMENEIKTEYVNSLRNMNTIYSHYVALNQNPQPNQIRTNQQKRLVVNADIQTIRDMHLESPDVNPNMKDAVYTRLAEIVTKQILANTENGKVYRQFIANDRLLHQKNPQKDENNSLNRLQNRLKDMLIQMKALEGNNVEYAINQLQSNELAVKMAKSLKIKKPQRANEAVAGANANLNPNVQAGVDPNHQANNDGGGMHMH